MSTFHYLIIIIKIYKLTRITNIRVNLLFFLFKYCIIFIKKEWGRSILFRFGELMNKQRANNLSPIVLAFVGDAVYSLYVREKLTFTNDSKTCELNKLATSEVNAVAQSKFVKEILEILDEEELNVFKRARNAKKSTKSKHASVADYNASTGFEAVLGYLYLTGNYERLNLILNKGKNDES